VSNTTNPDDWAARQRLTFIEDLLVVRGWARREDLIRRFSVSGAVATADFSAYQRLNPEGLRYSRATRRYERLTPEKKAFARGRSLLDRIEAVLPHERRETLQEIQLPGRAFDGKTATAVSEAILNQLELEAKYLSVNSDTARWRWLAPVALVNDGFRFHIRAWCSEKTHFADFNLGRILAIRDSRPAKVTLRDDPHQSEVVEVVVVPRRGLGPAQRQAVEVDYKMTSGRLRLRTSMAHLFYVLLQLGILPAGSGKLLQLVKPNPRSQLFLSMVRPQS